MKNFYKILMGTSVLFSIYCVANEGVAANGQTASSVVQGMSGASGVVVPQQQSDQTALPTVEDKTSLAAVVAPANAQTMQPAQQSAVQTPIFAGKNDAAQQAVEKQQATAQKQRYFVSEEGTVITPPIETAFPGDMKNGWYFFTDDIESIKNGTQSIEPKGVLGQQPMIQPVDPKTGQPVAQQPQVDPLTGQPVAQQQQSWQVDPKTGQPVMVQPQQQIDPNTGQPIAQQPQIDPKTGQPIAQQPQIDPLTGQPMVQPQQSWQVDPKTGQPVMLQPQQIDPATGQPIDPTKLKPGQQFMGQVVPQDGSQKPIILKCYIA